jgi:[acyl-carrier-protein] S-malonyltransferase
MTKTAWVFPGQGSQKLGMGSDLIALPSAQEKFEQAEEILGWSVINICQRQEKLSCTLYTQPVLYVIESILADLLKEQGQKPDVVAGHSLGEYIALYVAGVFDWSTGLKLVKERAEIMNNVVGGRMAALMNFDHEQLVAAIAQNPHKVVIANDNSPNQVVISGIADAVQEVISLVKAKRALILEVSGAFHSPLMTEAALKFQKLLEATVFQPAIVPVLSNVDPVPSIDAEILKQRLSEQMTGSVRWREISLELLAHGIERVVEVGPGNVLTGLIKRTVSGLGLENISDMAAVLG